MNSNMDEQVRRENVELHFATIIASFGGQYITYGEPMKELARQLADRAEQLARDGYLPSPESIH